MDKIIKFLITMELLSCLFLLIGKLNFCYYEVLKSFFELQGYFETWEKYGLDCLFKVKTKGSS